MPFQKGQSGNPGGKPKSQKQFKSMLLLSLAEAWDEKGNKMRGIADKLVTLALNGEEWAIKEIADRTDGKVAQSVIGDEDGPPVQIHHEIIRRIVKPTE